MLPVWLLLAPRRYGPAESRPGAPPARQAWGPTPRNRWSRVHLPRPFADRIFSRPAARLASKCGISLDVERWSLKAVFPFLAVSGAVVVEGFAAAGV